MPWTELCPAIGDLSAHSVDATVLEHVRHCPRCATLVRELAIDLGSAAKGRTPTRGEAITRAEPPAAVIGEIYALRSAQRDELALALVVALEDRDVAVVAVREGNAPAVGGDVALPESVLGFDAVVAPVLGGWVLPEQLDGKLGTITATQAHMFPIPERRAAHRADGQSEDTRLLELLELWDAYLEPARSLRETDTLGELVQLRQLALNLPNTQLARAAGMSETDLETLRDDQANLLDTVSPQKLAGVLGRLSVLFSEKLAERISLTLAMGAGGSAGIGTAYRIDSRTQEARLVAARKRYLSQVGELLP